MKFKTKLWRRNEKSYAATIPQALVFRIDPSKKYYVEWNYDNKLKKWHVDFKENKDKKSEGIVFKTSLWKRSQRSYATTVPHAVILHIDEEKEYEAEWEFESKTKKWIINIKEVVSWKNCLWFLLLF